MKPMLAVLALITVFIGTFADSADADIVGPCEVSVADEPVRGRSASDPADAISIDGESVVRIEANSLATIGEYRIEMEFAGVSWTVARDTALGSSWDREVRVDDYARFGVGLYRIHAVSLGSPPCTADVLVKITGRHPLSTPTGVAAAALLAAGTTLAVRGARRGAKRSTSLASSRAS